MNIPKEVADILSKLIKNGFEAYAVGGCVRDFLINRKPKDWDITTNAQPEKVQEIFKDNSIYENNFGTVTVLTESKDISLKEIQITTYRIEEKYSDKRHPDKVKFTSNLKEDLSRRDFTINAIAYNGKKIIDPFDGQKDLKEKIIRAVGNPEKRFSEDSLRILRAVRFSTELNFSIEEKTLEAIRKNALWIESLSKERIRDEIIKIIMSENAKDGFIMLQGLGLLKLIIPELSEGYNVGQNKHHIYSVFEHSVLALDWAVKQNWSLDLRIASLLHDVGKPRTKRGEGPDSTFYGHDVVGSRMTLKILERLKFPKKFIEKAALLVRYHLFYYNVGEVTEKSVRRLIAKVGLENMEDLLKVRMADRKGSGVPKAEPYKLRHLKYMIEKVSRDPISLSMLKINGNDIIKTLQIEPGPKIGMILNILLGEVIDDPSLNRKEYLEKKSLELGKLEINTLKKMMEKSIEKQEDIETEEEKKIKEKFRIWK